MDLGSGVRARHTKEAGTETERESSQRPLYFSLRPFFSQSAISNHNPARLLPLLPLALAASHQSPPPFCCPGDVVLDLSNLTNQTIKLGGGLYQDCDAISVMKAGKLRFSKPNKYWVESSQKRYVPHAEDSVLGIVVDSRSDNFLVDIKGPSLAFLPVLAFEGGTRRNIPKFENNSFRGYLDTGFLLMEYRIASTLAPCSIAGTLIYVRVVKANPGMNPELSCTDATGRAAEYGALKEGFMFECSTGLSRTLLSSPTCPVLEALGKKLSFEIAVGLNGRVWVNSASPSTTIIVSNAIMNSESLSGAQQRIMVEKLLQRIQ
ncbi:hypothetical protein Ahy_A02g008297 isoform A [Arachis hypogaea]|uniref:Ribosomal RNA-processing protein 40 n=1 Tax=Arachis hypogaea TaxID=3818 RepID=A0A445EEW0_ARAHY|nr:hypothetical protein Ahy_A02g008297 isoform A [Arachis hypogaea]